MPNKGFKFTEESRKKLSLAKIGNTNHTGKKASDITKERMRVAHKGLKQTSSHRSAMNKGLVKHSQLDLPNCNCYVHKAKGGGIKGTCPLCLRINVTLCNDHDHVTGMNREMICMKCNMMLGHINDNIETLQRMVFYLLKHREVAESAGYDPDKAVGLAQRISISMK